MGLSFKNRKLLHAFLLWIFLFAFLFIASSQFVRLGLRGFWAELVYNFLIALPFVLSTVNLTDKLRERREQKSG